MQYSLLRQLMEENPELAKMLAKEQSKPNYSLLSAGPETSKQEQYGAYFDRSDTTPESGLGMWETAMGSVVKTLPVILQLTRPTGGFAPAARGSSRSNIQTPNIYPQGGSRFRSLLTAYLRR